MAKEITNNELARMIKKGFDGADRRFDEILSAAHAVTAGCRNFRVTTLIVSENGKVVDELVEVFQR